MDCDQRSKGTGEQVSENNIIVHPDPLRMWPLNLLDPINYTLLEFHTGVMVTLEQLQYHNIMPIGLIRNSPIELFELVVAFLLHNVWISVVIQTYQLCYNDYDLFYRSSVHGSLMYLLLREKKPACHTGSSWLKIFSY